MRTGAYLVLVFIAIALAKAFLFAPPALESVMGDSTGRDVVSGSPVSASDEPRRQIDYRYLNPHPATIYDGAGVGRSVDMAGGGDVTPSLGVHLPSLQPVQICGATSCGAGTVTSGVPTPTCGDGFEIVMTGSGEYRCAETSKLETPRL